MIPPFELLNTWLAEEQNAGAPNPCQAVLATCGKEAIPHARVVAIREINECGLRFFTQRGTRKVTELEHNPSAVVTFWFELLQRQVVLEGVALPLSDPENQHYWESYPRQAQLRFCAYAPTSAQPINDKNVLENKKNHLEREYEGKIFPLSEYYCGYLLKPSRIMFYAYRTEELSDVFDYSQHNGVWIKQWLSP